MPGMKVPCASGGPWLIPFQVPGWPGDAVSNVAFLPLLLVKMGGNGIGERVSCLNVHA